jgi:hypothetical protein
MNLPLTQAEANEIFGVVCLVCGAFFSVGCLVITVAGVWRGRRANVRDAQQRIPTDFKVRRQILDKLTKL